MLLLVFFSTLAMAQDRVVTGVVTSSADGTPLPGVSVVAKGTTTGSITGIDGDYRISVPSSISTLVFSYVGFKTQEIEIGSQSKINISLEEDTEVIKEVVVTALGISQEKASLGYGVSSVDSKALQARTQKDVSKLLRGKATGVDIVQTSGLAGSGTNVIIRGYSSITGSNQPLFVVDGIPFNSDTNNSGSFAGGGGAASSRFLDLDPQTIENVSILKGLSATVLYGEAGRNGVILITTKNGGNSNSQKGFEVSFTQQVSATQIANIPDYQDVYGNGFSGDFGWYFSTWGPSFDTRGSNGIDENGQIAHPLDQARYNDDFPEFIGARYDYKPYKTVENFFKTGLTTNTSVSVAKSLGEGSQVSASYSYLNDEGFLPNLDALQGGGSSNFQKKHNFGLGIRTKLDNGISVRGTFNYVDSDIQRPLTNPSFGGTGDGLFASVLYTPRSIDLMNIPYQSPIDGSMVYYRRGSAIEHPLWNLNNKKDIEQIERFFANMQVGYEFTDWLKFQYRISLDNYTQTNERKVNRGSGRFDNDGYYNTTTTKSKWTDHVANLIYDKRLDNGFSINGLVGLNYRIQSLERNATNSQNQLVYGLFAHDKFVEQTGFTGLSEEHTLGIYATATAGYSDFIYVTLQARNDFTSTLEKANRSIIYPSASVSFLPFEAIPSLRDNGVVDFAKFRVSYGTSAGYPSPYRTRSVLNAATNVFIDPDGTQLNTNTVSNRLGNPNLTPELHSELEFGMEAQFLNGRIGLDLSLYNKNSKDLIIDLPLDPATGYTVTTVNGAEVTNKGIELAVNFTPVKTSSLQWDATVNFTRNVPTVESIISGVDQVLIAGYGTLGNVARPGQPYGAMLGTDFNKDANGNLLVDGQGSYTENANTGIIGNPNPDFTANWSNTLTWKGISFGFQWSYVQGGDIYSSTVGALMARGNTVDTGFDRFQPIILPGVKGDGTPNDIQTYAGDVFFDAYFGADAGSVFDATVIRLREVSIAYALPKSILTKTPFGSAAITISGENLFYNAPNFPKGINFDPEVLSLGVGNGRGFDFRTAPTAKRYGATLSVTF